MHTEMLILNVNKEFSINTYTDLPNIEIITYLTNVKLWTRKIILYKVYTVAV